MPPLSSGSDAGRDWAPALSASLPGSRGLDRKLCRPFRDRLAPSKCPCRHRPQSANGTSLASPRHYWREGPSFEGEESSLSGAQGCRESPPEAWGFGVLNFLANAQCVGVFRVFSSESYRPVTPWCSRVPVLHARLSVSTNLYSLSSLCRSHLAHDFVPPQPPAGLRRCPRAVTGLEDKPPQGKRWTEPLSRDIEGRSGVA